jgi:GAF domain-containing protein
MGMLTKTPMFGGSIFKGAGAEHEARGDDEVYVHKLQTRRRLAVIQQIGGTIPSSMNEQLVYQRIVDRTAELVDAEAAALLLLNQAKGILHIRGANGPSGTILRGSTIPLGRGIAGWVAQEGRPLFLADIYQHPRLDLAYDQLTGFHPPRAMLIAPLKKGESILGVIQALNKIGQEAFDEEDIQWFLFGAAQVSMALGNTDRMQQEVNNG